MAGWSITHKEPSTAPDASIDSSTGVATFPANTSTTTNNAYTITYDAGNGCTQSTTYTVEKSASTCTSSAFTVSFTEKDCGGIAMVTCKDCNGNDVEPTVTTSHSAVTYITLLRKDGKYRISFNYSGLNIDTPFGQVMPDQTAVISTPSGNIGQASETVTIKGCCKEVVETIKGYTTYSSNLAYFNIGVSATRADGGIVQQPTSGTVYFKYRIKWKPILCDGVYHYANDTYGTFNGGYNEMSESIERPGYVGYCPEQPPMYEMESFTTTEISGTCAADCVLFDYENV